MTHAVYACVATIIIRMMLVGADWAPVRAFTAHRYGLMVIQKLFKGMGIFAQSTEPTGQQNQDKGDRQQFQTNTAARKWHFF